MLRTEKVNGGRWDVYTVGDHPRRVGIITGGRGRYIPEMSRAQLAPRPTLKAARAALEDNPGLWNGAPA